MSLTPDRIAIVRPQEVPPLSVGARDAARLVGLCEKSVRDLASRGELPSVRVGNRLLFRVQTLDRWLAARESGSSDFPLVDRGATG